MKKINGYSFLVIGDTKESTESGGGFKRYVGLAGSFIKAVNPNKKVLDELMGYESKEEPKYVVELEDGTKEARVTFIVRTDPASNNGIEITNRVVFPIRQQPAYNKDKTKVQVIDTFGNTAYVDVEDAKAGNALPASYKIDQQNYRMAAYGEADLVAFLKTYLGVPSALNYVNGAWVVKTEKDEHGKSIAERGRFALEFIKKLFDGDFSEIVEAYKWQVNNKIKLLYGVRTSAEGNQYQAIATKSGLFVPNNAGKDTIARLEKKLNEAKANGAYSTTDFQVCELKEWVVKPADFDGDPFAAGAALPEDEDDDMPWS